MKRLTLALVFSYFALVVGGVQAAELAEIKSDGLVGERADGYLGLVVDSVPDDVAKLVSSINNKRRAEYERIAGANELTVEQVQALAGKKAIERTSKGGWIMVNGGWQQK
jgi:uncharacterized protein YdbL (DUF1318 family)